MTAVRGSVRWRQREGLGADGVGAGGVRTRISKIAYTCRGVKWPEDCPSNIC